MNTPDSLDEKYFDDVYAASDDPWNFETSDYEAQKYAQTIASLPSENYANAIEIGCSIGILTRMLSERCSRLIATDVSERALEKARERNRDLEHVEFRKMSLTDDFPDETFDLIVISEVAYYLSPSDWAKAMREVAHHLAIKGHVVLVHWLPAVHDYPQTGDEVHRHFESFASTAGLVNVRATRKENYRLDVWEKAA